MRRQLKGWAENTDEARHDPSVLLLGLTAWTRMHGILSLEIEGFFAQMGIDAGRLVETEVDHLIAQRTGRC